MKLEEIGFYTLKDSRVQSPDGSLARCELILTDKCNFNCHYCRGLRKDCAGEMEFNKAKDILNIWFTNKLKNVRFSGGEPTLYPRLIELVELCVENKVERIALSTNGSMPFEVYKDLYDAGVNDFSISLDACCSSFADKMAGTDSHFDRIKDNIKRLSELTYVTVGIVLTEENLDQVIEIITFADSLNVGDIRIISAAQFNKVLLKAKEIPEYILLKYPILRYRVNNIINGRNVRGIQNTDCNKCHLVKDDMAVSGKFHFPCIIYMREQGDPIGEITNNVMNERKEWCLTHNTHDDIICRNNCLDVCIDYNNKFDELGVK
jgi:molybdenum cofactor biosynthesis enzyme MoaA